MTALLEVRGATVRFPGLTAVDAASFSIGAGEMLGLVGESGCGKTTLGRAILRLVPLAGGELHWQGRRFDTLGRRELRALRRELQFVFQDLHACMDPRMTIVESVSEPLRALAPELKASGRSERALALLAEMGLAPEHAERYPHQLSGGQLQRAVIARALIVAPRFVVCDEPTSALDVSVQGQIVNLLARIRRERGLAGLFIGHNLAVVAGLCERIMVMYLGRLVEISPRRSLIEAPLHPYTRRLLDSVPTLGQKAPRPATAGAASTANAEESASACAFAPRCPHAIARCRAEVPALRPLPDGRHVACHRADEWPGGLPGVTR